ncbi:HEAT repeat domain-containing protein [Geobacter hydrogenophilus]|uniref:PBS lyase n=1 Tax=Geobacter hydrogenophilus TaxID=40983 RepID=A0A9W6FZT4_9BACT|nr:HEAT repeat domain-containing protein [Geobacter hydrogenophilus]MBT0893527.1 HEAT repeat domain-containing protein [Geobacter hydrogenophilus]GLI37778.1 PBS lyase [Geobacter hydrogenophilus]
MVNREEQHNRRDNAASRRRGAALAELHKALKAMGFYPEGHPLRAESLRLAFGALREAVGEEHLLLAVGKGGFAVPDGEAAVEDNPMAQALARELFIRRVRRIAFLADLTLTDLESFLSLLSLDYRSIPSAGGMEALMAQRGITTIWANEIDLDAIGRKRQEIQDSFAAAGHGPGEWQAGEAFLKEVEEAEIDTALSVIPAAEFHADGAREQQTMTPEELIDLMAREPDDERYRELSRAFVKECLRLQDDSEFERLFPILERLLQQANDGEMGLARRGSALLAFDQTVGEGMVGFLVRQMEEHGATEGDRLLPFFAELGSRAAAPLAARLRCAEGVRPLKNLASGLMAVGDEAVEPVLELLADGSDPVVQAAAEILGEIGTGGCLAELRQCLGHRDEGVRREVLRSLVRIGGPEAEEAIIACLDSSRDPALRHLAVVSLGVLRSGRAVEPLLAVVARRDLFASIFSLKKVALAALGRIGDRRAVPALVALLRSRHWFFRRQGEELRCLAAAALGQIGDSATLPLLSELAAKGGRLGAACGGAVGAIEQRQQEGAHD